MGGMEGERLGGGGSSYSRDRDDDMPASPSSSSSSSAMRGLRPYTSGGFSRGAADFSSPAFPGGVEGHHHLPNHSNNHSGGGLGMPGGYGAGFGLGAAGGLQQALLVDLPGLPTNLPLRPNAMVSLPLPLS